MNKFYLALGLFSMFSLNAFSQDEEEVDAACNEPGKKTVKLIETAKSTEDIRAVVSLFDKAIEAEPENAMAYYEYGAFVYERGINYLQTDPTGEKSERAFENAAGLFSQVLELCPDYNAGAYYYLGVIRYMQRDNVSAQELLTKFVNYKNEDNNRFPNDYGTMLKNAKGQLKKWEESSPIAAEENIVIQEVPFSPSIVKNVSSKNNEYFPMISPDNEMMFYTRKIDRKNLGDMMSDWREEFTFSQREALAQTFDAGNPFKAPFNDDSFESYGAATMSIDNKEMIICACKIQDVRGQSYKNCDLYSTTYSQSGNNYNWSELKSLGSNVNTIDGWEGQPSISADGNTLYFSSSRKDSRNNDNDIYISERKADGGWGIARPFDEINTDGKDKSPFIHQDNETFYFVSTCTNSRPGAGGTDIFYIKKKDGKWSKPKNIGVPINTSADELGLFVSTDGELAYYSSNQGGDYNIYGFKLYEEARPTPVMIMKGVLTDKKGDLVSDAEIEISYGNSDEIQKVKVNGDDGKYAAAIKMDSKQDVLVSVKKEGAAFSAKVISKEEIIAQNKIHEVSVRGKDMEVSKLEVGGTYVIEDILYSTASADLNQTSKVMLKAFARYLNSNESIKIVIQGHTDDVGDDNRNLKLSDDRAKVVKDYLVSQGVAKSRLEAKGYGETQPKVDNVDEESRAKNRRTEFKIVAV